MKLYRACRLSAEEKTAVVKYCLDKEQSLRKTARQFGISYPTVSRWIRKFGAGGQVAPALPGPVEKKVMLIKESRPALSLRRAQDALGEAGTAVSLKYIWSVWKRYGLIKDKAYSLNPFVAPVLEDKAALDRASRLVENGDFLKAAKIVNGMAALSSGEILKKIPEHLLSPRRRLERLYVFHLQIPYPEELRKIRRIRRELEKKGYIYSSILAEFFELEIMEVIKKPAERIKTLDHLHEKVKCIKNNSLKFLYNVDRSLTHGNRLQLTEAYEYLNKCRQLVRYLPAPYYRDLMGTLLVALGRPVDALAYHKKALERARNPEIIRMRIARYYYIEAGQYRAGALILKKIPLEKNNLLLSNISNIIRAYLSFGRGDLAASSDFYLAALKQASRNGMNNHIYVAAAGLAAIAMALNKKGEARSYLTRYIPLMKKNGRVREEYILRGLSGSNRGAGEVFTRPPRLHYPLYLLHLLVRARSTMKTASYWKAYNYAAQRRLLGVFHRWIVFYPEVILKLQNQGRPTGLPRTILKFPVFNQRAPVYHVKFLGAVAVFKNEKPLKADLSPQLQAFLIQLALRAKSPGRFLPLDDLYKNFWPANAKPAGLLLHLLVDLKKRLRLPGHLLGISSKEPVAKLINHGLYFTTDYGEFENLVTQIATLERAEEWPYARREYHRLFRLIRGEPFVKMYDPWSELMRRIVMDRIERSTADYRRLCRGRPRR